MAGQQNSTVKVKSNEIGGIVTGANGAEPGVWVIAETTDFLLKLLARRANIPSHRATAPTQLSDREARGLATLNRIAGENAAKPLSDWSQLAPDMRNFIVEFIAGDVLSRPDLTSSHVSSPR